MKTSKGGPPCIHLSSRHVNVVFLILLASALGSSVWTATQVQADIAAGKVNLKTAKHPKIASKESKNLLEQKAAGIVEKTLRANGTKPVPNANAPMDCLAPSSFQEVQQCNTIDWRTNDSSCQESIETWADVQRCLNRPWQEEPPYAIQSMEIHLIGERSTGSKFVVEELKRCFPLKKFGMIIHRDYLRPKHWFQRVELPVRIRNRLVVATFRDPFTWIAAMIEKPYHSPHHMKGFDKDWKPIPLDWEDFVSRPWSPPNRTQRDLAVAAAGRRVQCSRYNFPYHQVMPCLLEDSTLPEPVDNGYFPLYELRRNSTKGGPDVPYDNLLQLRSDKTINFLLEVPLIHQLGGFMAVRYEDLIGNGTRFMLEQVAQMMGLPGLPKGCKPQSPQPWRFKKRNIPEGLKQWINDHLNLETEKLLNYPYSQ